MSGAPCEPPRSDPLDRVREVQRVHEKELLTKANVVGVGLGLRRCGGQLTDDVALVVMVRRKVPSTQLAPDDVIPSEIDGVPVDVQVMGTLDALRN